MRRQVVGPKSGLQFFHVICDMPLIPTVGIVTCPTSSPSADNVNCPPNRFLGSMREGPA